MIDPTDALRLFEGIDVYLFDQLQKGRIGPGMRVLDAGCGGGRNLRWILAAGCEVHGLDANEGALELARREAASWAPSDERELAATRFHVGRLEEPPVELGHFDVVICNAVLHFARDNAHFDALLDGAWGALGPGGLFFARLASSIGIEDRVRALGAGRFSLPDGTERYLVDEARLVACTERLGAEWVEPLKTVHVQGQRCMSTWVLRRR